MCFLQSLSPIYHALHTCTHKHSRQPFLEVNQHARHATKLQLYHENQLHTVPFSYAHWQRTCSCRCMTMGPSDQRCPRQHRILLRPTFHTRYELYLMRLFAGDSHFMNSLLASSVAHRVHIFATTIGNMHSRNNHDIARYTRGSTGHEGWFFLKQSLRVSKSSF